MSDLPLHIAVETNRLDTAEYLLNHKANPNDLDRYDYSLLQRCNDVKMMVLLVNSKATVYASDFRKYRDDECSMVWAKKQSMNAYLAKIMWEQTVFAFCDGLHLRLGAQSSIRRAWTSELSERHLIWLIGLFLKPSAE